jgi:hypothetical protein
VSVETLGRRAAEANEQEVRSAMNEQQHSNAARRLQVISMDIVYRVCHHGSASYLAVSQGL